MEGDNSSSFSVHVDPEPGTPGRWSTHPGAAGTSSGRSGPVAEGVTTPLRASPRKANPKRTAFVVLGTMLFLVALCAAVGYFVFLRPEESGGSRSTSGDLQASGSQTSDATDRSGSASGDTPGTRDFPTEESPEDGTADDGTGDDTSGADSGSADGSSTNGTAAAPATGAAGNSSATGAGVSAPGPNLKPVPVNPQLGFYDPVVDMPVIPVAAAVLPSGKVLMWSAEAADDFGNDIKRYVVGGGGSGQTYHAVWDPKTGEVTEQLVANTDHDMFCPGITMLPNGDIIVTGGQNADATSIFHLADGSWNPAPKMHISRGYGSSCLLSDGRVFVMGGSWSGPKDLNKDAEVYNPTTGKWNLLPNVQAAFILTDDPEDKVKGSYRADNYGWFYSWSNATVFHAGPSTTMHWFGTKGEGNALLAGTRPGGNSANGISVMFDKGKILSAGGSEAFAWQEYPATQEATLITLGKANILPNVKVLKPMVKARVYANACVLPDGKVFITGGAHKPKEFSDQFAHYEAEIWDPATETFTLLESPHVVPRTYHSVGVLLPDGRVFTGGGGLCGDRCDVNHLNMEIYNPPYLFNADGTLAKRPQIKLSAAATKNGGTVKVTSNEQLMMVSMIRMGSATHSTNTDQRRIELCGPSTSPCTVSPVSFTVDADPGIALPGNWMIFGVNAKGVPSVASTLLVGM